MNTLVVSLSAMLMLLSACGDNDGNDDTLLTGFSGVIILIIAVLVIRHFVKKRG